MGARVATATPAPLSEKTRDSGRTPAVWLICARRTKGVCAIPFAGAKNQQPSPERVDPWFARFRLSGAVASACWRAQRNGASCMRASRLAGFNRSHARTDVLVGTETVHGLGYEVRERG